MAEKQIKRNVTVAGVTYTPDDKIPADVAKQIENDKVYEELDDRTPAEAVAFELSKKALDSSLKPVGDKHS